MTSLFPAPCTCASSPHRQGCPQFNILRDGSGLLVVTDTVVSPGLETEAAPLVELPGKCNGRRRQGDEPSLCRRPAGWGTDHVGTGRCKLHGGKTKTHVKSAQKAEAKKAARTLGLPVEIDPAEALLQEVWRSQGHVVWYGEVVAQLRKGDLGWGITKEKTGGEDYGTTREAKTNIYLALYNEERKHLARVSAEAIKAGVEQKRLDLETHRAELVVAMLGSIFDDLELTPEQALKLDELVPKALTGLAALEAKK